MCQLSSYVIESSIKDLEMISAVAQVHSAVGKHDGISEKK